MNFIKDCRTLLASAMQNYWGFLVRQEMMDFNAIYIFLRQASNHTFWLSIEQDLSITKVVRILSKQLWVYVQGEGDTVHRLCLNLQVDISKVRSLLGWGQQMSVKDGLRQAIAV
jgi:nucleoside-diphosphate-sugar epimerase